jgi:outer membrane translocation and assembly module TamA
VESSASAYRDWVNNVLDPSRGTSIGLQGAYSDTWTGSEELQRFARVTGDASLYCRSLPDHGRVPGRGGVLSTQIIRRVPSHVPEQRFTAGPTTSAGRPQ